MWEALGKMPTVITLVLAALALFGGGIGSFIGYYASRKANVTTSKAQDQLIKTLDEIIRVERQEKDDYRNKLHEARDAMQRLQSQLDMAMARPDLTKMYEVCTQQTIMLREQSDVLTGLVALQRELLENFKTHEKSNGDRQQAITTLLETLVSRSLNGQVKRKKIASKLKQA